MVYISQILVWIFFILVVISIILVVAFRYSQPSHPTVDSPIDTSTDAFIQANIDIITQKIGWSKIIPSDDTNRNTCLLYTFPSSMDGNKAIIGQPTLNFFVLDSLTPQSLTSCIDSDQIVAQKVKRTCQNEDLGCIGFNGLSYLQGQDENLYQACKQPNACSDTLALIGLQYNSNNLSTLICVQASEYNTPGVATSCDVSKNSQLFRIDRADPVTLKNNSSGQYARIGSRTTNLCLSSLSGTAFIGAPVGLIDCNINTGYVWWVFPPFSSDNGVLPQQLVYTTSIEKIPQNNTDMNKYLQDNANNLFSLFINTNNNLSLQPMIISNPDDPNLNSRNTQILDLPLYNLLLQYNPYNPIGTSYPAGQLGY